MNALIRKILMDSDVTVTGGKLFKLLGIEGVSYTEWFKQTVLDGGFVEGEDYTTLPKGRGHSLTNSLLREIILMSPTAEGRMARKFAMKRPAPSTTKETSAIEISSDPSTTAVEVPVETPATPVKPGTAHAHAIPVVTVVDTSVTEVATVETVAADVTDSASTILDMATLAVKMEEIKKSLKVEWGRVKNAPEVKLAITNVQELLDKVIEDPVLAVILKQSLTDKDSGESNFIQKAMGEMLKPIAEVSSKVDGKVVVEPTYTNLPHSPSACIPSSSVTIAHYEKKYLKKMEKSMRH